MLELKKQELENDLKNARQTIKEVQNNHPQPKIEEKNQKNVELEAIVQYLSLIILSKPENQNKNEETIYNLKNICGENFFKIMEELYLKINDYEFEAHALKEKITPLNNEIVKT